MKKIPQSLLIILSILLITNVWAKPVTLKVIEVPLTVNNKSTKVYDIVQENGIEGYVGTKGKDFDVDLKNDTKVPMSIHWHGLVLPNDQDGVAYVTQLPIPPGKSQHYHFPLYQAGTYWMHAHYKYYEQQLMAAPLILLDPHDQYTDYRSVVVMLQDFTFKNPDLILHDLKNKNMDMGDMDMDMDMDMSHDSMKMTPDLNDVKYDAYLANRRTLSDPQKIDVKPNDKIRLRIINASAATNYWVHLGDLLGTLIAEDGENIKPITGHHFQIAIAQRLDILVTIPKHEGIYPILAQVEGTKKRSGIILVTPKAPAFKISSTAKQNDPALNDDQEMKLHALQPLPAKTVTTTLQYSLEGDMQKYIWMINKEVWPRIKSLTIKKGDRVEMIFTNQTNMAHPMHLHGHVFQVIEADGKPLVNGPLHDTILVLPHSSKKIIFDANNPGIWPMHCHVLYHMMSGMMTTTNYQGYPEPNFYRDMIRTGKNPDIQR